MTSPPPDPAAIVRRWVQGAWNEPDDARRAEKLRALHPPELLNEGERITVDQLAAWHVRMRGTYPDLHYRVDELVACGERVTLRWTATGTQRGSLWGLIPPTGRTVRWSGLHLVAIRGGQIHEIWAAANVVEVLQQLGVGLLPPEAAAE